MLAANGQRLSQILGALASAADLANGFPLGKVLRTALLAVELARAAGHDEAIAADAYLITQLRYLGCTAFAHDEAHRFGAGDDIAVRNTMSMADAAARLGTLRVIARGIAPRAPFFAKATAIARLLTSGAVKQHATAQCNAATQLGRLIGIPEALLGQLAALLERWDGLGAPLGLKGEATPVAVRVHNVADVVEIAFHRGGLAAAKDVVRSRRAHQFEPRLCDAFLAHADRIAAVLGTSTLWEDFIAAEPGHVRTIAADAIDDTTRALGFFADLKSTYLLGHSQRVAELAAGTAAALGFDAANQRLALRAGHLHDLGRVAIATGTWDRPGPLGVLEWEQVRLHTYHTDRVLALSPALAEVRKVAASAHERGLGDGYHRGLDDAQTPPLARVLAVCDAIVAMGEARAHRPARNATEVRDTIGADVHARRYDARIADAALSVAGLAPTTSRPMPSGLSEREREVLVWVARGKTNKEIGILLGISARTVQHHVAHIYDKAGLYSRAGAAIFAMEHHLVD